MVVLDDDNEPLLENVSPAYVTNDSIFENEWGHNGIYSRRIATNNSSNPEPPQLNNAFSNTSRVELFEAFFMKDFINETIVMNINKNMNRKQMANFSGS